MQRSYQRGYQQRRSFRGKRKGKFARPITYGQIGSKVWKDVQWLKSVVNVERKHLEFNAATTSSTTAAFVLLNGCIPGSSGEQRDGQSIKMTSVFVRYNAQVNVAAIASIHRVMIFTDSQPDAAAPTAANLLDAATNVLSPLNIDYAVRFKVHFDKSFIVNVVSDPLIECERYIKLDEHTKFNAGTAGTIADITTNSLYMMHMSSEATNTVTFNYYVRTRFIDN